MTIGTILVNFTVQSRGARDLHTYLTIVEASVGSSHCGKFLLTELGGFLAMWPKYKAIVHFRPPYVYRLRMQLVLVPVFYSIDGHRSSSSARSAVEQIGGEKDGP